MRCLKKIICLNRGTLQVFILLFYLLSSVPAFAILDCNSPEYQSALCSQTTEALKIFTARLNAIKNDIHECSKPPPRFVGIECTGEFPTVTCPDDASAQKAFLDALEICNRAKEGDTGISEPPPETFTETPSGPGETITDEDIVPPVVTQPPSTGPTVTDAPAAPPASPGKEVVAPPEPTRPSVVTRPRDPNAYREFIPELPGYGGTQDDDIFNGPILDHGFIDPAQAGGDESKPMVSEELAESFKSFPRQPVKEEATIVIEVVP